MSAPDSTTAMPQAALAYAEAGWAIFPCQWPIHDNGRVRCSCKAGAACKSIGKHPLTKHGVHDASRDPDAIKWWWTRYPNANIGAPAGPINNTLVLDVDPDHGGSGQLVALQMKHGPLPETLTAITGSGGRHYCFSHAEGLANQVGAISSGLDIRTRGGYIVIAPSLHKSGQRYRWLHEREPAAAPPWLIEEIKKGGGADPALHGGGGQTDYWSRIAKGVGEGERHVAILKLAGLLAAKRKNLPPQLVLALVRGFNARCCQPPLPESEVDERVKRVVKREYGL